MHSLRCLRKGGRLVTVGNSGAPRFEIDNRYIFARHLSIIGSTMSTLTDFATVMDLVGRGTLRPVIDRTYPLNQAGMAHERLWHGESFGKITLDIP
jgi:NADPH:quinone reductase-like Zn-dependent oxidoreductase